MHYYSCSKMHMKSTNTAYKLIRMVKMLPWNTKSTFTSKHWKSLLTLIIWKYSLNSDSFLPWALYNFIEKASGKGYLTYCFRTCFWCYMIIIKDVQQLNFNCWSCFIKLYIQYSKNFGSVSTFQIFGWVLCISIVFEYRVQVIQLMKMKVLIYRSYKENFELYTETHSPITVNSCKTGLAKKDITLLSNMALIHYTPGLHIGKKYINTQFAL